MGDQAVATPEDQSNHRRLSVSCLAGTGEPADSCGARVWGWLPALSLTSAAGLLFVALADTGARVDTTWAAPLFWIGLLVIFAPAAARLCSPRASTQERIGLIAILGVCLYVVKVLHSPVAFTFYDEFAHWRTANDIAQSGRLFLHNPLGPVKPFYPGLEIVTNALTSLSGISIYSSGILLIAVARLVLLLALYLLYEEISGSAQVAGIASLLYMANPNFLFFDAQFAYESLGLPLAMFGLLAMARRARGGAHHRIAFTLVILVTLGAVVVTHHISTYAFLGFLALWAMAAAWVSRGRDVELGPRGVALLALVMSVSWLVYVAILTVGYLAPVLGGAATEVIRLILGEGMSRELFRAYSGQMPPLWERLVTYGAVGLVLAGLPLGLYRIWRQHRANALALSLAAATLAYPASLAFRMTQRGAETANRMSEFLFVAIAFVLAVAVVEIGLRYKPNWTQPVFPILVATMFAGGVATGWAPWARMPGPYLVAADSRSIEPEGMAAASWARAVLGPGTRLVADRTNRLLMGSYGEQHPVTSYGDKVYTAGLYFTTSVDQYVLDTLRQGRIAYVVVDLRLASSPPMLRNFIEHGQREDKDEQGPKRLSSRDLRKFDRVPDVHRVFDSGSIIIYDVRQIWQEAH